MQLPYDICAFDDFLSCSNLQNHYEIYLDYVTTFNKLKNEHPLYAELTPEEILENPLRVPRQIRTEFSDVAGGIYNHETVFNSMTPISGTYPDKILYDELSASFGNAETMKKRFIDAENALSGSGYAMIVKNPSGSLGVISMPNEESSLADGMYPILAIDLWEHAYTSDFFERKNHLDKWFERINWNTANERYAKTYEKHEFI